MSSHKPFTLLLSGSRDSGKTWLADEIRARLAQRGSEVKILQVDETSAWPNPDDYVQPIIIVCVQRPNHLADDDATENAQNHAFDFTFLAGVDSVSDSVSRLLVLLEEKGLLARDESEIQRDEQILIERLTDLGYL
jgi:hypothetical protein